jgi:nucleotide-binding universal stress UspA family protein
MARTAPENAPRRVAVFLGSGGTSRSLLDLVLPLLGRDQAVEMKGVFLEEAEVKQAADLPFVQELCRVTFSVREFNNEHFERALALRMRTAQRALSVLARRTGVSHSFQNVRGSAVGLLCETARDSDITLFEPVRNLTASLTSTAVVRRPLQRIVVVVDDVESGRRAIAAALQIAEGHFHRITVLLTPAAATNQQILELVFDNNHHDRPSQVRTLGGTGAQPLIDAVQAEGAALLVIGATRYFLKPDVLRLLRDRLRCPVCLVRQWGDSDAAAD